MYKCKNKGYMLQQSLKRRFRNLKMSDFPREAYDLKQLPSKSC